MHPNERQQHISFLDLIWRFKGYLALYIIVISFLTFIGLYLIGGVPDELKMADPVSADNSIQVASTQTATPVTPAVSDTQTTTILPKVQIPVATAQIQGELPTHVTIDKIGVNVSVSDPVKSDSTTLDNDLLKGAVRYPGSGTLAHGNLFIFAHSTGIKIVNNQAYKAFNHLDKLNIGDIIKVSSATKVYTYAVTSVRLADSNEQFVNLVTNKNMITLTTCDVFGEKQQRFVVEAELQ